MFERCTLFPFTRYTLRIVLLCWVCGLSAPRTVAQEARVAASGAVYLRSDTNSTTVWSPRADVQGRATDELTLSGSYAADAWTSASVDIVAAATGPVHEVRHEVNAGATYALKNFTLGASYRYSTENDYWSHGGVLRAALDLAQRNTTLALALFGSRDLVGHVLDETFRERQYNLGARLSWTQVLDGDTWAQLSFESTFIDGYQASPYRYVAIGGGGTCGSLSLSCLPEHVPERRLRHAAIARLRRALGRHFSVSLEYRYYFDSWRLASQTIAPGLSYLIGDADMLSLGYRYYTQRQAQFYRPRYLSERQEDDYVTRDKELSALFNHQLQLEYLHDFVISAGSYDVTLAARASISRFRYLAFVGLSRVHVLECTLVLGFQMR